MNAEGEATRFTYDALDNKLTETNALLETTTYTYNADRDVTSVTDNLGHVTRTTFNNRGQPLTETDARGFSTVNAYDPLGNLVTTTDASGAVTRFAYDDYGNLTSMTDAAGQVTRNTYDRYGNQDTETDALGHITRYTSDGNGNRTSMVTTRTTPAGTETLTTSYVHDAQGRVTHTTMPDGATTQTEYNTIGKVSRTVDALGRATTYTYDDQGRQTRVTHPDLTWEGTGYDAEGRRTSATDRAGRTTTFGYDRVGRQTRVTHVDNTFTQTGYDAAGRVVTETNERGYVTRYFHDAAGRRTTVRDARGKDTVSTLDENGNVTAVTDANGNTTTFVYDRLNRRTRVIAPDLSERVTAYDNLGRRVSETDQAGRVTQYGYDVLGRLTSVTDALNQVTSYAYDELGNHVSQTDANSHTTRFEYDRAGRRVKRTLPLGMYETMAYDAAGNMAAKTDFNGHITTFNYDVMHRLLSKTPDPVLAEPTVSFTYFPTGQRQSMSDATGVTTYAYDDRDRLLEKATPQGTLTYTWDASGNVTSIVSSNVGGTNVQYTWDENNRLKDVIDVHAGTFTYSYDDVGNETGLSYPNGIQKTTTYDAQNRLRTIGYTNGISTVASYAYALDSTGRRTGVVEHSGRTVQYGYDALYRLTSEEVTADPNSINGRVEYTYDPVGNRLRRDSTLGPVDDQVFTYNANDQIEGVEQYDLNGNVIQNGSGATLTWDFESRMTSVGMAGVALSYNGDGELSQKRSASATVQYLYQQRFPWGVSSLSEQTSSPGGTVAFAHGLAIIGERGGGAFKPFLLDGLGSVRAEEATTDGIVAWAYDAFGAALAAGAGPSFGYRAKVFDVDVELYRNGSRWLSADTGRFQSRDQFLGVRGRPQTLHGYQYANADPVNNDDATGFFTVADAEGVSVVLDAISGAYASLFPPKAANGTVKHLTVDTVQLDGSSRPLAADVQSANRVFRQCGISVTVGTTRTVNHADTVGWINSGGTPVIGGAALQVPGPGDLYAEWGNTVTGSEREVITNAKSAPSAIGNVTAIAISGFRPPGRLFPSGGTVGYAYIRQYEPADIASSVMITNAGSSNVLAHELGHILLDRGHYEELDRNPADLMYTHDNGGTNITEVQCWLMRSYLAR